MHKEKEFRISSEILKKDQGGVAKVLGKKIGSLDNGVNGKARARSHYNDAVNNFDLPKLTDLS